MNRLKELRQNAGLSQAELAKAADTTQRNISYWESGKIELNLYAAIRLAQVFQVDVAFLAGYTDELGTMPDVDLPYNFVNTLPTNDSKFTERFNEVLKFEQTNQSKLANQIGIARQCITDYKSGKSFPTIQTLSRICTALDTSSDYLLGLSDDLGAGAAAPMGESLTAAERELLANFRKLSPYLQGVAVDTVRNWAGSNPGNDLQKKA